MKEHCSPYMPIYIFRILDAILTLCSIYRFPLKCGKCRFPLKWVMSGVLAGYASATTPKAMVYLSCVSTLRCFCVGFKYATTYKYRNFIADIVLDLHYRTTSRFNKN